jgi:hypothetical protein
LIPWSNMYSACELIVCSNAPSIANVPQVCVTHVSLSCSSCALNVRHPRLFLAAHDVLN